MPPFTVHAPWRATAEQPTTASALERRALGPAPSARGVMRVRATNRLGVLGLVATLAFCAAGCGGGGGSPDHTTSAPLGTAAVQAAECRLLEDAVTTVTSAHPDGVGLAVGSVPNADQVAAMHDLVTGLEAVTLASPDALDLRRAIVVASQSIIDRSEAEESLTEDDQGAFAGALTAASDYCGATSRAPVTTTSASPAST